MVRVAVLGASGRTGLPLVQRALDAGHDVVALVRCPEKIPLKHDSLQVKKIELFSKDSLVEGFRGCDVVVSCLGKGYRWFEWNVTFFSEAVKVITAALKEAGVKRFIHMSSAFAKKTSGEPFLLWGFLRPVFLGAVLRDMARAEDALMAMVPELNVTIVKPSGLNQAPIDDQEILTRVGEEFVPGVATSITRNHVAKFMVDALTDNSWDNKSVAIAVTTAP